jgi:hypothetical protein
MKAAGSRPCDDTLYCGRTVFDLGRLGVPSNYGDPMRSKAIDHPGGVSLPIHSTVTYNLDLLVPIKGLEEVFVEVVLVPGDQDGPSTSSLPWLHVRHVRYWAQSAAKLEPDQ